MRIVFLIIFIPLYGAMDRISFSDGTVVDCKIVDQSRYTVTYVTEGVTNISGKESIELIELYTDTDRFFPAALAMPLDKVEKKISYLNRSIAHFTNQRYNVAELAFTYLEITNYDKAISLLTQYSDPYFVILRNLSLIKKSQISFDQRFLFPYIEQDNDRELKVLANIVSSLINATSGDIKTAIININAVNNETAILKEQKKLLFSKCAQGIDLESYVSDLIISSKFSFSRDEQLLIFNRYLYPSALTKLHDQPKEDTYWVLIPDTSLSESESRIFKVAIYKSLKNIYTIPNPIIMESYRNYQFPDKAIILSSEFATIWTNKNIFYIRLYKSSIDEHVSLDLSYSRINDNRLVTISKSNISIKNFISSLSVIVKKVSENNLKQNIGNEINNTDYLRFRRSLLFIGLTGSISSITLGSAYLLRFFAKLDREKYNSAYVTDDATTYGDKVETKVAWADILFTTAEGGLLLTASLGGIAINQYIRFKKNKNLSLTMDINRSGVSTLLNYRF